MSSKTHLARLPPELRRQIFLDVAATDPGSQSLLMALRPTIKYSNLYVEAIEAYYIVKNCTISWANVDSIQNLSPEIKKLVRFLQLDFSLLKTASTPVRFAKVFRFTTNYRGRIISHQSSSSPIFHKRFLPRPTFETIAAFANIQSLHLNAAAVEESRFHQIEGMVKRAVQVCARLRRVEVQSDMVSKTIWVAAVAMAWRREEESAKTGMRRTAIRWWVERLSEGMGVDAKLVAVDSSGLSWHWFWEAEGGKTLVWTESQEVVGVRRRVVVKGVQ